MNEPMPVNQIRDKAHYSKIILGLESKYERHVKGSVMGRGCESLQGGMIYSQMLFDVQTVPFIKWLSLRSLAQSFPFVSNQNPYPDTPPSWPLQMGKKKVVRNISVPSPQPTPLLLPPPELLHSANLSRDSYDLDNAIEQATTANKQMEM